MDLSNLIQSSNRYLPEYHPKNKMDKPTTPAKSQPAIDTVTRRLLSSSVKAITPRNKGIYAALTSAVFLGLAPVFGKQAILFGAAPLVVVAIRTLLAALALLVIMLLFSRQYLYIYPAGLLGCILAGWINGLGSLFYYSSLGRIGAGVGQLLYSLYPFFLVFWLALDKQLPGRMTLFRIALAIPAIYLLTQTGQSSMDWIGVLFMLIASALYALHIPINQRVLYEMPAQTVAVYTLFAMSTIVVPTFLIFGNRSLSLNIQAWWPIVALTLVTFLSRITLFMGVKHIGGMQTALLGLSELLVTLLFAHLWLGESFNLQQWAGVMLLVISLFLVVVDKTQPKTQTRGGWLSWLSPLRLPSDLPWQSHD